MKKPFLYQAIASDIMTRIVKKTYSEGEMLESSEKLMQQYGASIITINKALGILADLGYIKRIPGKGSVVHFAEKEQGLSSGSRMIGAVVYDMAIPDIWAGAVKAIENHLYPLGYQLLVGNDAGNIDRMIAYIDQFASQGVEGLVFAPLSAETEEDFNQINQRIVQHIEAANIPYVVMHRVMRKMNTIQVGFDNHQDALELMDTLFEHNGKSPLLLSHSFYNSVIADRERGFLESLWQRGVVEPSQYIVRLPRLSSQVAEQPDFLHFLRGEIGRRPNVDTLIAVDDHILKLLHMVEQSRTLFCEHPMILSGFGTVDDVLAAGSIDIYQRQDPTVLGEVAISHLLEMIKRRSLGITQIIRIPSVLTFGECAI